MKLPGHSPTLAPGMTQTIYAGEHYTIMDTEGRELELEGRLDEATVRFLKAFDAYMLLKVTAGDFADMTKAGWRGVIAAWDNLPKHVRDAIS
jgi:hypothetical protein